ncbi:TlpA family protein disulfide reductase [Lacimicrobium alkaliphilum]|uniref:Alkyl hydroperoxide reductase subunit C/ Thiol specific antioxidant domain-containing protein n=1 Tax=Lacimicrobium alkaliphilum TaxID=1526571 RepID=A0A0U2ZKE9_9ALTE|nr:TlpA disulfide reductase family protein [Lacimicrobium alkaliphilum]ALS99479.1 hypothetical protein AT746_15240 [Lacimicrobium alkaliphilum]
MRKWIVGVLIFLLIVTLFGAHYLGFFAPSFSSVVGNPIQRVELTDLNGDTRSFDELEGNATVIYFFASWCRPCYKTLAMLQETSQNNTLQIDLLTVALDGDLEGIVGMLDKTGFSGKVWLASEGTMALQRRYFGNENRAVPYIVMLDNETNIVESSYYLDSSQWETILIDP